MTNGREIKPTKVHLTIYENTHGRFPTLLVQFMIIAAFVALAFLGIALDSFKWGIKPVSYTWREALNTPDISVIAIKEEYLDEKGSKITYHIYDEEHKTIKGGKWKYGNALPDRAYIATGEFYEGKYPEIYLNEERKRVAYIDIDLSAPENRHRVKYVGIELPESE